MASDPGNSEDGKPGKGKPDAAKPASPAPASPARGPFLIVTPPIGQVLASQAAPPKPPASETPPGQTPPPQAAPQPAPPAKVQPARPASASKPTPPEPAAAPSSPAPGEREEPILGDGPPDEPTYDEPDHHEPPRLVDPPPPAGAPQAAAAQPAKKPAPRPSAPSLAARSADRLAELNGPPPRRRGGCLFPLLLLLILAGGGYFLWRAGKLHPLLTWAEPYTAPVVEKIKPIIAKIESFIPGHQEEAPPAAPDATSDEAMIMETKQLLQKLDFNPGPIDGTLDPATVAAIQAYQEAAGENVDGQPSQALLEELRSVANPPAN